MAHKVILPPKKNYIPQFLKQRDINSYYTMEKGRYGTDMDTTADCDCLYFVIMVSVLEELRRRQPKR
jgi:hypothetical protein